MGRNLNLVAIHFFGAKNLSSVDIFSTLLTVVVLGGFTSSIFFLVIWGDFCSTAICWVIGGGF